MEPASYTTQPSNRTTKRKAPEPEVKDYSIPVQKIEFEEVLPIPGQPIFRGTGKCLRVRISGVRYPKFLTGQNDQRDHETFTSLRLYQPAEIVFIRTHLQYLIGDLENYDIQYQPERMTFQDINPQALVVHALCHFIAIRSINMSSLSISGTINTVSPLAIVDVLQAAPNIADLSIVINTPVVLFRSQPTPIWFSVQELVNFPVLTKFRLHGYRTTGEHLGAAIFNHLFRNGPVRDLELSVDASLSDTAHDIIYRRQEKLRYGLLQPQELFASYDTPNDGTSATSTMVCRKGNFSVKININDPDFGQYQNTVNI